VLAMESVPTEANPGRACRFARRLIKKAAA
jgi:hypothetical protein